MEGNFMNSIDIFFFRYPFHLDSTILRSLQELEYL